MAIGKTTPYDSITKFISKLNATLFRLNNTVKELFLGKKINSEANFHTKSVISTQSKLINKQMVQYQSVINKFIFLI